jgi:transcriptional regulator with XRE-family HTH domain
MLTVGEKIRIVREIYGMKQKDFASILGISAAHVSKIESSKDFPSQSLQAVFVDRFSVDKQWFDSDYCNDIVVKSIIINLEKARKNIDYLLIKDSLNKEETEKSLGFFAHTTHYDKFDYVDRFAGYFFISLYDIINKDLYYEDTGSFMIPEYYTGVLDHISSEELDLITAFRLCNKEDRSLVGFIVNRLSK